MIQGIFLSTLYVSMTTEILNQPFLARLVIGRLPILLLPLPCIPSTLWFCASANPSLSVPLLSVLDGF